MVTAEVVDPLLDVLRKHGVARFRSDASGVLEVDFYPGAVAPVAMESVYPPPASPLMADSAAPPVETGGHRPVFEGIPKDDPLFDGMAGRPK